MGVNTFMERLTRTLYNFDKGLRGRYDARTYKPVYYNIIGHACSAYYNNTNLNYLLLNNLSDVFSRNIDSGQKEINLKDDANGTNVVTKHKRQYTPKSAMSFLKRRLIHAYLLWTKVYLRSPVAYEDSKWLNKIFSINQRIIELPQNDFSLNSKAREKIKECCKNVFLNSTFYFEEKIHNQKKEQLSNLFSVWIDHIIPISLLEGLTYRFNFYRKILKGWNIKYVHSPIGFYYNDNFKCFAILAKRKKAKLIGHEHGVNNFLEYNSVKTGKSPLYKSRHLSYIFDYYLTLGNPKLNLGDVWNDVEKLDNIKIINNGSVYFNSLNKWEKPQGREITLLYVSGPSREFMANLQEVTPEKMLVHKKKIYCLLEELLCNYVGLNILYKTFMGIDLSNDPITKILPKYLEKGRVKLVNDQPVKLMPKVSITFFDMISTGFAEAVQIGVPTLIYNNKFDYELASDEGKIINDELEKCGIIFYERESGIKSFERIVNDLKVFQQASKEPIRRFQEAIAYPVSKKEFLKSIDKNIE